MGMWNMFQSKLDQSPHLETKRHVEKLVLKTVLIIYIKWKYMKAYIVMDKHDDL